jgi:segregation and condensation protein B
VDRLTRLLEAALFAASHPLPLEELRRLDPEVSDDAIRAALTELRTELDEARHGVEVAELADGYQLLTRIELAEALAEAQLVDRPRKLSPAAMETLAIVAYRQPVGRAEIEEIRGVAADGVLRMLVERGLIEVVGRGEGLGRPLLYGTTPQFLEILGLRSLDEMPRLEELSVALTPMTSDTEPELEEEVEEAEAREDREEAAEAAEAAERLEAADRPVPPATSATPAGGGGEEAG